MSRYLWVKIDIDRLQRNLSAAEGRIYSVSQAEAWLKQNGFVPSGDGWVATTDTDLAMLDPNEMLYGRQATHAEVHLSRDALSAELDDEVPAEAFAGAGGEESEFAAKMPKRSPLDFPTALVGTHRDVVRRWKPVTRRAVKDGHWDDAVRGLEMRAINDIKGSLIRSGPVPFLPEGSVLLYPVLDLLMQACKTDDRDVWYAAQRNLLVKGFDQFWFCLASLAQADFLIVTESSDADRPNVATVGLPRLLRWWGVFCDIADRFYRPLGRPVKWTQWGGRALAFSESLGMTRQELRSLYEVDARTAGKRMAEWLHALDHKDEFGG